MTTKKLIARIKRKKGCMYFIDGKGIVWEQPLNKGMTEKMKETIKKKRENRYF